MKFHSPEPKLRFRSTNLDFTAIESKFSEGPEVSLIPRAVSHQQVFSISAIPQNMLSFSLILPHFSNWFFNILVVEESFSTFSLFSLFPRPSSLLLRVFSPGFPFCPFYLFNFVSSLFSLFPVSFLYLIHLLFIYLFILRRV